MTNGTTNFAVWAPNARSVSVVGDFNDWNPREHLLKKDSTTGIWSGNISRAKAGDFYKYAITSTDGNTVYKSDPYGRYFEPSPGSASIIHPFEEFDWEDENWIEDRVNRQAENRPISIYEVHLGSWKRREDGSYLSYQNLADELIPYAKEMGFTHLEIMPVTEYPYDPSWGYQPTGFFAPTSRYGRPEAFMSFVNECHKAELGLIMDWVPAHFPKDEQGLRFFDGTPLFEPEHPLQREHKDWGTHAFDFSKAGVRNFLLSSAHWWIRHYHIDALRLDAVASMLYRDYSRNEGEWIPNKHGENENLEAIDFLRTLNSQLHDDFAGVLTFAEESTAWPGVTASPEEGGLGFDYKWNMGWMNDTLEFMKMAEEQRRWHPKKITFPIHYAHTERFVLPLSHDEVVHLKKSLALKAPGPLKKQLANLRLLFTYMIGHPGKKLIFMGGEFAQLQEWSENRSLDWHLLLEDAHKGMQMLLKDLLEIYQSHPHLHDDTSPSDRFEWKSMAEDDSLLYAFVRKHQTTDRQLLFICNFSSHDLADYHLLLPNYEPKSLLLNSNSRFYGGDNRGTIKALQEGLAVDIPAFSAFVIKIARKENPV